MVLQGADVLLFVVVRGARGERIRVARGGRGVRARGVRRGARQARHRLQRRRQRWCRKVATLYADENCTTF